ncbi:MAG: citrate transporter [Planctomycetes bacterium]|nr:citrate transporter [Planctomycetota bacterium]
MLTAWILVVFVAGAVAMMRRAVPALLALPLMAVAILAGTSAFGSGLRYDLVFGSRGVFAEGCLALAPAMIVAILGGVLSHIVQHSGAAERLVKTGAELGGEHPLGIALSVLLVVALLFTTIGGLGAVVMVSMIVLPILGTVGVGPLASAGILLFGISLGGLLNPGNWVLYTETLKLPIATVQRFAMVSFVLTATAAAGFVGIELLRAGAVRSRLNALLAAIGVGVACAALVAALAALRGGAVAPADASAAAGPGRLASLAVLLPGAALVASILWDLRQGRRPARGPSWQTFLIPVVPLVVILVLGMHPVAGFVVGIAYAWLATWRQGSRELLPRALLEGGASVLPAVVLMLGIGLLITTTIGPTTVRAGGLGPAGWPVLEAVQPLFLGVVPESALGYVVGFGLLAPLALYRGPFNLYGLGFGVATILRDATPLTAAAIMGLLMSLGIVQGVSDPTNTQNVWLANELRVDVQAVMLRTLPFAWGVAVLGLVASALMHFGGAA